MNNGIETNTPITTLAYLVALVDSSQNAVANLDKAKFVLRWLFDVEEQVENAPELLSRQHNQYFPKAFYPQSPVMLTLKWSPISAMLERGWEPIVLDREDKGRACAFGIWKVETVESYKPFEACQTPEELFWHVFGKVAEKAKSRGLLICIIAKPGWSYEDNFGMPCNLTLAEAQEADRVIWQRTPKQKNS